MSSRAFYRNFWKNFASLRPCVRSFSLVIILVSLCLSPGAAFGENGNNEAAFYLWRLINEARACPMETIHRLGIDESTALKALGGKSTFPPLAWNDMLAQAASNHNNDMVTNLYYSSTGLEGSTVSDRIKWAGYRALSSHELLGAVAFSSFIKPLEATKMIFDNLVRYELDPSQNAKKAIFNKGLTEIGISFIGAVLDLGKNIPVNVYIVVADLARPVVQRTYILGNVYRDIDGNKRFDPGEGIPGMRMIVRGYLPGHDSDLTSQVLGAYQFEVPPGFFTFEVLDDSGMISKQAGFGYNVNHMVDFRIE